MCQRPTCSENWKVENIFPEVFLLEFITENFVSLNYFCLAIFPFFSVTLDIFFFLLYSYSHFVWAAPAESVAHEITANIGSSDTDPNGLVDSLKFYHCVLSAWRIQSTKQNHNVGSTLDDEVWLPATTIHRHREQCKTFQEQWRKTSLTHSSQNHEEKKVSRFTENEAYHFSFDAKQKNAFLIRFMCCGHFYSVERRKMKNSILPSIFCSDRSSLLFFSCDT